MTVTADPSSYPLEHDGVTYYFCCAGCRRSFQEDPAAYLRGEPMLIKNDFEVAQPVEKVWEFFGDIPQVATCLPGAELTEDLGGEKYKGQVAVRMGPVRLQFAGTAEIAERDEAAKRLVLDAAGAEAEGPRPGQHGGDRARWSAPAAAPRSTWRRTSSCPARPPSTAAA